MGESIKEPEWRRGCANGTCVEVARVADRFLIRDSKNKEAAPLSFTSEEWFAFVRGIKEGAFQF